MIKFMFMAKPGSKFVVWRCDPLNYSALHPLGVISMRSIGTLLNLYTKGKVLWQQTEWVTHTKSPISWTSSGSASASWSSRPWNSFSNTWKMQSSCCFLIISIWWATLSLSLCELGYLAMSNAGSGSSPSWERLLRIKVQTLQKPKMACPKCRPAWMRGSECFL